MLKEQKNQKIELSQCQEHPNEALAEDFEVLTSDQAVKNPVPFTYGDLTPKQYAALLKESGEATSTKPAQTGKSGLAQNPKRK